MVFEEKQFKTGGESKSSKETERVEEQREKEQKEKEKVRKFFEGKAREGTLKFLAEEIGQNFTDQQIEELFEKIRKYRESKP